MKRTACQSSVQRRFRTLQLAASKINGMLPAHGSISEAAEALEALLEKKNIALAHGVWFPETCHGIALNCGYTADIVLDGQLAVVLDAGSRRLDVLEREMQECLFRGDYAAVALVRFGKYLFCHLLCREELPVKPGFLLSAISALDVPPPESREG